MRQVAAVALIALLAGCPASQSPDPTSPGDDGPGEEPPPASESCPNPQPTCSITFRYSGPAASSVQLRGDFAPDGWTNGVTMTRAADGAFEATVPANDQQVIVYKMVVDGETWIADPANERSSPDGFGGRNSVVRVDCDHCPARPAMDWRDAVIYMVLLDRFANGNSGNDAPLANIPGPVQYQGGDLIGLRAKIEEGYFNELGVTTLWLSSPIDAGDNGDGTGYHGYWPSNLDRVESRLGTEADLRAVVDAAHARGIQVLIDYVMNHVHSSSPVYAAHRDWFWPNDNGEGGDCICGKGCNWDDDRLHCWFDPELPDFNFGNGDARRYSVENAVSWVKRLGIDGFRLDAVKHIETSWITDVRARLDAEVAWDQPFYMVGETFDGNRDLIKSYVDPRTMLDGQFDFPLRAQILSSILRRDGSMEALATFLATNDTFYGEGAVMSTFLGNHDVPRVVHLAEDEPLWGSWDGGKDRAWEDQPTQPTGARPYERLAVAFALVYTSPGAPMLYYGDELALAGAGDPDNRRFMPWGSATTAQLGLKDWIAKLGALRARHPATRRGTRTQLGTTRDTFVYKMAMPGDTVFVALNRGDAPAAAAGLPAGTYADAVTGAVVKTPVTLAPRSALILTQ